MYRKIINKLETWKNSPSRKPLMLHGARQVGKTWILREFAKEQYKSLAYISCDVNKDLMPALEEGFDIPRLIRAIGAITGVDILPHKTLIVIDEIQEMPLMISALKYFCELAPEYHIAVAGSMLGVALHGGVSYPVGKVNTLTLYPMDFEEFLLALGEKEIVNILNAKDFKTLDALHSKMVDFLRQYYYVGGMPEVVKSYTEEGSLGRVREIQKQILTDYEGDFSKHAPLNQVPRINMVWQSVPAQLAKENKKFIYGMIRKGARAKDYELALQWLVDAGLIYKVSRSSKPQLPLKFYEDNSAFKIYILDCGLLGAMSDTEAAQVLIGNRAFTEYKGAFTEQYALQQLICSADTPIYYFSAENSRLEMDFLLQHRGCLVPVEIKAEKSVRANSFHTFLQENPEITGIRCSMLPYKEQDRILSLPLYDIGAYFKHSE